jgi:hypothetical protein
MFKKRKISVVELPGIQMNTGAPMPMVFEGGLKLFVIFFAFVEDGEDKIYTIEFDSPSIYKFGSPNDEVLSGHPYYKFGLKWYSFSEIINSDWIEQIKKINSVHYNFKEDSWKKNRHFIIPFHDETFECIAEGYQITTEVGFPEKKYLELVEKYIKVENRP